MAKEAKHSEERISIYRWVSSRFFRIRDWAYLTKGRDPGI